MTLTVAVKAVKKECSLSLRTMFKMNEEKNLHSCFIAFLLNPQGTHGRGTKFLEFCSEELQMPNFRMDGNSVCCKYK